MVRQVNLATGRLTNYHALHLYIVTIHRVIRKVWMRVILLQSYGHGNQTRVTQPESIFFQASYPLDQYSLHSYSTRITNWIHLTATALFRYANALWYSPLWSSCSACWTKILKLDASSKTKFELAVFFERNIRCFNIVSRMSLSPKLTAIARSWST